MSSNQKSHPGWSTCQSIAMELDAVTSVLGGALFNLDAAPLQEFAPLIQSIPRAWLDELEAIFQVAKGFHSTLEMLALLSDVLFESDYNRATLAMRSLDVPSATRRLQELNLEIGENSTPVFEKKGDLGDQIIQFQLALYGLVDVQINREYQAVLRQGIQFCLRLIRGGDLHEQFWQWLDRFYYQIYADWRTSRAPLMKEQEDQVIACLGAGEKTGSEPDISWLAEQNPILRHPGLKNAVSEGRLKLYLWVEPIGLPDSWLLLPGSVVTSFSQAGKIIENFKEFTAGLAGRAAALSDPTRLIILRLIRHIDMTNTDMAEYLKISRPTVSIHARILREAGLIHSHSEGRAVRHEIVPEEVNRLFRDLKTYLDLPEE